MARHAPSPLDDLQGKRIVLVASTGGHLAQLVRLAERIQPAADSVWVTFDSPQSRALLHGRPVLAVEYVAPRDLRAVEAARRRIDHSLDPSEFAGVISTGAALALAGFAWARRNGLESHYIESVSRTEGPSLTGRIARLWPGVGTFTQHEAWSSRAWKQTPSVLNSFTRGSHDHTREPSSGLDIFVTLGTIQPYRFDRLVDQVRDIMLPNDTVTWQLGATSRTDLPGQVHDQLSADEFARRARAADVVITHSGVGTILQLLDAGISPVVVPRRKNKGEHVDNHQLQIFDHLRASDVAVPVEVGALTRADLLHAASTHTIAPGDE